MPRPAVLRPEVLLPEVLPMLPHVNLRLYRHGALRMTMNMCDATLPTIRECQLSICSCWRCQLLCTCTSGTQARISVYWSSRCRCSSNTSGSYGRTTEPMSLRPMLSLADRSDKSMYESVRPSQSVLASQVVSGPAEASVSHLPTSTLSCRSDASTHTIARKI